MFPASLYSRAPVAYLQTAARTAGAVAEIALPDELERKLDLSGGGLCGGNQARARNGQAILIENGQILGRRAKVGAVENVEKLGPELCVETFRNSLHRVVLEDREIQIRYSWANQTISAQISPTIGAREGKALSFDIGVGVAGIDQGRASRPPGQTGGLARLVHFHSRRIAAQDGRKRLPRAGLVNAAELPAAQRPFWKC